MESQAQNRRPALRSQQKEMIPTVLLRAMFGIALATLVIVSYAVYTGREKVGQPEASAIVREKWIVLEGKDAKHVVVRDVDGTVLLDLKEGGFVTVIQSGMHTERRKKGVDQTKPLRIVEYANGRLAAEDPETGWSVELYAFGADNKAAFQKLLDM